MKLRGKGERLLHDARLIMGGPLLRKLGYRVAIRIRTNEDTEVFVPPQSVATNFKIVWANRAEWKALRRYGFTDTAG